MEVLDKQRPSKQEIYANSCIGLILMQLYQSTQSIEQNLVVCLIKNLYHQQIGLIVIHLLPIRELFFEASHPIAVLLRLNLGLFKQRRTVTVLISILA
jgi:hypothetical protein